MMFFFPNMSIDCQRRNSHVSLMREKENKPSRKPNQTHDFIWDIHTIGDE